MRSRTADLEPPGAAPAPEARAPLPGPAARGLDPARVLALQGLAGNRAVARVVRTSGIAKEEPEPGGAPAELHDHGLGITTGQGTDSPTLPPPFAPEIEGAPGRPGLPQWEPPPGPQITSTTMLHAPDGTADDRTKIAIGELVTFAFMGGAPCDWTASSGYPRNATGQAQFVWERPTAGLSTITATNPATGDTATRTMEAILPEDMQFTRLSVDPPGASGRAGAGMEQRVTFLPTSVNFHNAEWLEDPGPPEGPTGYFPPLIAALVGTGSDLDHHPNTSWLRIRVNNTLFDHAAIFGLPPPFSDGTFHYRIPNRFRRAATTGTGRVSVHTVQRFRLRANGNVTVSKRGRHTTAASVTSPPAP